MSGVMACYRGCIKAVYAREDAGLLLTRLECRLSLNTWQNVPTGTRGGKGDVR